MSGDGEKGVMAISGASGLVGSALSDNAKSRGWSVVPMVRRHRDRGIYWSVEEREIDAEALAGVDAVVHLAGASIARRWTGSHKQAIVESRVVGTRLVAEAIASLAEPPEIFICASGVDYYGSRGDEWVDESSESGEGFLADVCRQWEAACEPASHTDCRVVNARFAMVLSSRGGALSKMLTPFQWGVGGRFGDGEQYMSWVSLHDLLRALFFVIDEAPLAGGINMAAPNPVTNQEFAQALGDVLDRPAKLPVPAPLLKLAVGTEMAREVLLSGQRVRPWRLLEAGFEFDDLHVSDALCRALKR